jgi:hypothetical protein
MFRAVPLSIIKSISLDTQQWHMSYRFADSLQAGSEWNILILLASCQQTGMTYTIAVCTVENWWWTEELSETCRVSLMSACADHQQRRTPNTHGWHTHAATYCVIIQTQRTQISGGNSNDTKHSGGPLKMVLKKDRNM